MKWEFQNGNLKMHCKLKAKKKCEWYGLCLDDEMPI